MALIHQNLYQEDNLTGVEIKDYFDKLIRSLFDSYNVVDERISLEKHIEPLNLDVDTVIPVGLIVNELVSNTLEYVFPDGRPGRITVHMREEQDELYLGVQDDGVGFSMEAIDTFGDSFGFRLIQALKGQLRATLEISTQDGACVEMRIKRYDKIRA